MPRGLIVVLGMTGLLVTVLALQQFASIIGTRSCSRSSSSSACYPLTGILRRRGVPQWLAVTVTLITWSP